ncbi:hypothetical protein B0T13DRAFT_29441 [Neurospora crassa]|nr:hypothetical protein B0T13DRAFT_29441 [Neurospora crassa]
MMAKQVRYGAVQPLQIYQDDLYDQTTPVISQAPMPLAAKPPRRPLQPANSNSVMLRPPSTMAPMQKSPLKPANARISDSSSAPTKPPQGQKKLSNVQMPPPGALAPSTDSLHKQQPMSRFKTVASKPPAQDLINLQFVDQSPQMTIFPAPTQFNLPLENFYQKPSGKRVLTDSPTSDKESRPAKKQNTGEPIPVPEPGSFPPIIDDGTKPHHSYATLIGMAILRSPQRRLTLSQIYKWIAETFSFYQLSDSGWQNSIRHNLSLNKHFIKQERPKDDPGKGNYWAIEPGAEQFFMKEKPSRKAPPSAENLPVMSTRLEPSQPLGVQPQEPNSPSSRANKPQPQLSQAPSPRPQPPQAPLPDEPVLPPQPPTTQAQLAPRPPSSQAALMPLLPELSSDATIPASEIGSVEDVTCQGFEHGVSNDSNLYSPLPAIVQSSPPVPKHLEARHSTTPPQPRTKGRRKKWTTSMDDSGYISSLDSSILRPSQHSNLLNSADNPRLSTGRAEEEIARLRTSSYDSPSKGRSYSYALPSSSPLRQASATKSGQMLPPLTPAMKLKAPPMPPPSVSPTTNLRLHRESVQSMVDATYQRVAALLPEDDSLLQLTPNPTLTLDDMLYGFERGTDNVTSEIDIFQDSPFGYYNLGVSPAVNQYNGSPIKQPARRQRPERSQSTGALTDMTSFSRGNGNDAASFLKVPSQPVDLNTGTPSKVFEGLPSSPSKVFLESPCKINSASNDNLENLEPWMTMNDLCGSDFLEDSDFSGIDMLAGFEKIGSTPANTSRPTNNAPTIAGLHPRQSYSRCYSNIF